MNDIVYCTDQNYIPHMVVSIKSLLINNQDNFYNIHIIHNSINSVTWKMIISLGNNNCNFINHEIDNFLFANHPTGLHFTSAIYFRLLIPDIIKSDKALYLDSDTIICGDLNEVINIDLENNLIGAVSDPYPNANKYKLLGLKIDKYFNSGVMLMNLKLMRDNFIKDKVLKFISNNPNLIEFGDQDALNVITNNKWIPLHPKFNLQTSFFYAGNNLLRFCFLLNDLNYAIKHPTIIHFTESSKPWHFSNKHPYKKLYWKYRNLTYYKSLVADDFSFLMFSKYLLPTFVKRFIRYFRTHL